MRWPDLTSKPSPPKKQPKKESKRKKKKKPKQELLSYQSNFSFFWWASLKNSYASRNGHFWTQKNPNPEIPVIFMFFVLFLLFQQQKHRNALKPLFYSVLAKSKRYFQKVVSKHIKLKTQFLHPFLKRPFSEKRLTTGQRTKTQHDN